MAIKFLSAIDHGAYQLPTADGSNGQVLTTDGNGNVTFQSVAASANYYLSGASFNTSNGVLTLTVTGATDQTVDLDGRYALSNHVHNYDNYGSWNLKTNGVQRTTVQSGGDLNLVAGSNVSLSYSAGGTVTISSTDTNTDTNDIDYINAASFNTGNGILSLTGVGNAGASVDLDGRYLPLSGGNMSGLITFQTASTNNGFYWNVNSDQAGINFKNTGDGDTNSYLNFFTKDNGNEYFKFSHRHYQTGGKDYMDIKDGSARFNGDIRVNATQNGDFDEGTNYLSGGDLVWHTGDFSSTNVSNWNTAYSWGNHASAGYITDGNTGWNNTYGFITASSTDTLTNKSGNISQWTNDAGYSTTSGTVTNVTVGTGLDVSNGTTTPNITLDLSEFADMTAAVDTGVDELILLDNGAERRKRFAEIFGSAAYQNTSAFDSAGSAANALTNAINHTDDRIDNEVLPTFSGYLTTSGKAADSNLLDGIDSSAFLRSNTNDTFTGALTIDGYIKGNGQQLILSAGESHSYATGQTAEYIYLNAEQGLEINSETGNWNGGWAARKTAYLRGDQLTLDGETLSKTNIQNFKTAYGWGNHASAGYLTSIPSSYATDAEVSAAVDVVDTRITEEVLPAIDNAQQTADAALPKTGGTLTGTLTISSSGDGHLILKQTDAGSVAGTKEGGWNYMQFYDGQNDRQGYFGIDSSGHFLFNPEVSGAEVRMNRTLRVTGSTIATGTVTASGGNSNNWNTAYDWGDHGAAGYTTTTYVDNAISDLIDAAPGALDTLNELAAALGDDPNFATTMTNALAGKLATTHDMTLTLNGDVSGTATFTNMGNATLTVAIADDSHNHTIANVDGLQTALNGKLSTTGKAADSNLLDGLDLHTGRNNQANKVVRTDGNGYIQAGWINTTSGAAGTINKIYCSQDDYVRYLSPQNFRTQVTDSHYDAAGSAAAVNDRIDTEVFDAIATVDGNIPTNNNQLTNGAGYITGVPSSFTTSTINIGAKVTLTESSDRADLLYINSSTSSWGGLQIGNTSNEFIFSLMGDGTTGGIYDDQNSDWLIQWTENAGVRLYHNAGQKLTTTSTGITISGEIVTTGGNSTNWNTAYGWGNHASAGYLTSETYTAHENTSNLSGAYGGNNNGIVIEDLTVDANGHVTGVGTRDLDGRFDAAGSAATAQANAIAHADDRIENEILPAIPTNNNQLINGAGYVTSSGNTVIGTDSDINTSGYTIIDNLYMTDGVITSHGGRSLTNIHIEDTRAAEKSPNDYLNKALSLDFTDEFASLGSWYSGITLKGWDDGYAAWQLISSSNTSTNNELYFRTGIGTSWNSLYRVWHSGNLDAFVGASVSNDTITFTKANGGTVAVSTSDANTNYFLNGISRSGNTLTFSVSGTTNRSYTFGSAAWAATSAFDAAGSADAVHQRIDEEVMPAIPTNNNQLTNGAGYITSYVNTNRLTTFQVEDGDGTEVTISHGKEWKFLEGQGINVNWTDTSNGTDGDPYDLQFALKANGVRANELNVSGNGTTSQYLRSDGDGSFTWATPPNTNTQRSDEEIRDIAAAQWVNGTNTTVVKDDANNTIRINSVNTNTTYSADGNYGMTLSGTTFRLENDRRRNSSTTDIYTGNRHDFTWYDASVGIRWYTAGAEDMRLQDNGTLHVDGDVIAYSSTISDQTFKDDVVTIDNAIDKVKKLRGVEYTWNSGYRKGKRDIGLIAQEVEEVLPEIVHEHEMPLMEDAEAGKTYKTVDYEKMVGVLIEAMKEQQSQIDSLKAEVQLLKGK